MEENCEISLTEPQKIGELPEVKSVTAELNGGVKIAEGNNDLLKKLEEFEITVSHLQDDITSKTSVISDLEKQKGSLEKEVINVRSFLSTSISSCNFILSF